MNKLGAVIGGFLAACLAGGILYVESASTPGERILRSRACLLCHQDAFATLLPSLSAWKPGTPLSPCLAARLRQVHPWLSLDASPELSRELASRQLPAWIAKHRQRAGESLYRAKCAVCHGREGEGTPEKAPPLRFSEWITNEPTRLPEILAAGLQEPITVRGQKWHSPMLPPRITEPVQQEQLIRYLRDTMTPENSR